MHNPDYSISTPENVDLHLELAGIGNRILACLIDKMITGLLIASIVAGLLFVYQLTKFAPLDTRAQSVVAIVLVMIGIFCVFIIVFGYFIFFEGTGSGQTPGKRLVQIRVIDHTGQPVSWSQVFIRNIIRVFDEGVLLIGLLSMMIDNKERRFGDLAAASLVIRERAPEIHLGEIVLNFPAQQNETLDVGRITPAEYDLLVNFLRRRAHMDKSHRVLVADELAGHFKAKLLEPERGEIAEQFLESIYNAYRLRAAG
jgi:uncharacterized RDD family membrane protein YckC